MNFANASLLPFSGSSSGLFSEGARGALMGTIPASSKSRLVGARSSLVRLSSLRYELVGQVDAEPGIG